MTAYTIRDVTPDDAEATLTFLKTIADEPNNNILYSSADEVTSTVEEERRLIGHFLNSPLARWLLAVDEGGTIIGSLTVRPYRGMHQYTVMAALMVAQAWRNQGVGSEMARQIVAWCADNPHIKRVEIDVMIDNTPSIRVCEKVGFAREGVKQAFAYKDGRFQDMAFMAIVFPRPDFEP